MRAKALVYRPADGDALREVLASCHILPLTVTAAHLNVAVGRLVSGNAAEEAAAPDAAPDAPFLLLSGLGDRQLDRLLAALRRAGISIPNKAVLTETNREWTLGRLIAEVSREHDFLKNSQSGKN